METVLTGGKFNRIHPGHIWLLKKAKSLGKLVVVIANDKNNNRPYAVPAKQRKKQIELLGIADEVVIGNVKDFHKAAMKIDPSVIVLGYDQKMPIELEKLGKKVRIVKFKKHGNYSTGKMR
jgi:FAD synthetase